MIEYESVYLKNHSWFVPHRSVSNQELIDKNNLKIKASWIESRLGIIERRWLSDEQTTSDLLVEALKLCNIPEIPLFLSTISPDFLTPSTSSETKRKMGWKGTAPAFDLAAACAGLIFALELAAGASKHQDTCAAAAEARSRFLDLTDRRTTFLFADGATAFHLTAKPTGLGRLLWTHTSTSALREPEILIPAGGAKAPINQIRLETGQQYIHMLDGVSITETIEEELFRAIQSTLHLRGESVKNYDFFIFHQGNLQLIKNILKQMDVPIERTHTNFQYFGNSSSASVGVAFSEALQRGLIGKEARVLMVAMGAGYHLGLAGWEIF